MAANMSLLPVPRRLELLGGRGARLDCPVREASVAALPAEGYEIVIGEHNVNLDHGGPGGLLHGQRTLDQLRLQGEDGRYPAVMVSDWPDFSIRGYMLDVSRNRVPTRTTLRRLVEVMAVARLNQLQLYTEHTFAYRDHEEVWGEASPLTPDDIHWLDELCRSEGIQLVPNQNSFGHMGRWLKHAAYRWRAECPEGYELGGYRFDPETLEPTQENADFVLGLLQELMTNFSSRSVNVGCDETFELGQCRTADEVAQRGVERVYFDHFLRLVTPLVEESRYVQFWYDIEPQHAGLLAELPPSITALAWCYEALPEEHADDSGAERRRWSPHRGLTRNVPTLASAGVPFWVCPGTSSWNSFVGRIDNAYTNLRQSAEVGAAHGAQGYLITDWGDNGHLQPPSISFAPILYGGAISWCRDTNADADIPAALDRYVFFDERGGLGRTLEELGRVWGRTGQRAINASPMFAVLIPGPFVPVTGEPNAKMVEDAVAYLDEAEAAISRSVLSAPDADTVRRELSLAARLTRHGASRLLAQAGGRPPAPNRLREELAAIIDELRECWLLRSRPGGLENSLRLLGAALDHDVDGLPA